MTTDLLLDQCVKKMLAAKKVIISMSQLPAAVFVLVHTSLNRVVPRQVITEKIDSLNE